MNVSSAWKPSIIIASFISASHALSVQKVNIITKPFISAEITSLVLQTTPIMKILRSVSQF